ncbi:MAG: Calx-beta domain-containing protein [Campylobacterota bacterium]|nr:Calx-beta domain-containing protein [Campylobacterota bacterium]
MKSFFNLFFLSFLFFITNLNAAPDDYTIAFDSPTYNESAGSTTINIRVTPKNTQTYDSGDQITLRYETQNAGNGIDATANSDYTSISSTQLHIELIDNDDGTALVQVPVTILQDIITEEDEQFSMVITGASVNSGKNVVISPDGGLITIEDDDTAGLPTLSIVEIDSVEEDDVVLSVRVTLSTASASDVTFSYVSVDGTADSGNDYTAIGGTATISAGDTFFDIPVPILEDLINEGDETFDIFISNPSNATIGDPQGIITIQDDDVGKTLSINDAAIAESDIDKNVTIKVLLSSASSGDLSVTYHTVEGSATADVDYTHVASDTITIPAGSNEYNLTLIIRGDDSSESIENFFVIIDSVTGSDRPTLADNNSTVTIFDDDSAGTCSSYVGLMTVNEYQNNPHYFDGPRSDPDSKIAGNYVEIKYIDFLVKRFVTDDWALSVIGNAGTQTITWDDRDFACVDPRYEIFQFNNNVMGSSGYVTLKDHNGNEVDVLAIDTNSADYYAQQCQDFIYDTDFESSAQNKDIFREPDGTGDWVDQGTGANSGGSRCVNKDGGTGLLFTEFDGIDSGVTPSTPISNGSDVPIQTKVVNKPFDLDIISLEVHGVDAGNLKNTELTIKVYLGDTNGDKLPGTNPGKEAVFSNTSSVTVSGFVYDRAVDVARLVFEYCGTEDGQDAASWDTCYGSGDDYVVLNQRRSNSRNQFSIRPDRFAFTSAESHFPELLRAGQEYNLTLYAPYYGGADDSRSPDYNQTNTNIETNVIRYLPNDTEDLGGVLVGNLSWGATAFSMVDGISLFNGTNEVAGIQYSDVGMVTIQLQDKSWAAIDNDDTPQDCNSTVHTWICADTNTTFIPHHFDVNASLRNHQDGNFTYLSSDLNMSAHIDVNITAQNASDATTQNFSNGYYENPLTLTLTVPTIDDNGNTISSIDGTALVSSKQEIASPSFLNFTNGVRTIAWNESNTTMRLMFNYNKVINAEVNPFDLNMSTPGLVDTQILSVDVASLYTATDGTEANITGDANATGAARFYFARPRPSKTLYDNVTAPSIGTPIAVDVYCDLGFTACDTLGIDTVNGQINEFEWWINTAHSMANGDGNITLTNDLGTLSSTTVTLGTDGVDRSVSVGSGGTAPLTVTIDLVETNPTNTNSWLIYNPDNAVVTPTPFYRVRFIGGNDGWAGVGETGNVLSNDANTKTPNRVNW